RVLGEDLEDREELARHLAIALRRGLRLGGRRPCGGLDEVEELRAPELRAFAGRAFGGCRCVFGVCGGGRGTEVRRLRGLHVAQLVLRLSLPACTDLFQWPFSFFFSFLCGPSSSILAPWPPWAQKSPDPVRGRAFPASCYA